MESSTITAHLGVEKFYQEFMLNSSSPKARRSHKKLLTGNPFDFDIELDAEAESQSAQILHAYLKELGGVFRFIKLFKHKKHPLLMNVIDISPRKPKMVIEFEGDKKDTKPYDVKDTKEVITITPGIYEENMRNKAYEEKLIKLGLKEK
jgi:hypothetical protein